METALDTPAAFVYSPQQQDKVFAILTSSDHNGQIRGNRRNFIDLINTGTQMGFIVYVLPVERLSLQGSRQRGFVYQHANNRWVQRLMPFPNIIYNRIPNREIERRSYVKHKLRACKKDPRITIFNPYFFNKWELFKWLKASAPAKKYLPHTRRFSGPGTLEKMLSKHSFLYLKPESGKAGKGIMMISHKPDSTLPYRLNIQEKTSSTSYNCVNFNKLWSRLLLQMEKTPYIVQQGIDLATYRNRKFDLRVLIQKNIHGQWEMTGLGARVAGSTSITTHVPRGGRIDEPSKLLAYAFNTNESHNIVEKVSMAAVTIASQIEKHSKHRLGEMSMDIGVDTSGDVWFFEANSKPMKFDEPHIRQKSLQRIFQYSQYLLEN
ncbi:YheC/YheD family endospore coat-associated protein [Paenibacillus sp. FSL W7-1287]|uniref:YheC/YheD family endospore coat-associated protein n=1 Tax=Paenibacillus sp. FSL W7-1287 TaxID=2954538 RepID=UPI0030FAD5BA